MSEPRKGSSTEPPTLAFWKRGFDPEISQLPKPEDRTVLYLYMFEPGYNYEAAEQEIRELYQIGYAKLDWIYALCGISDGRESYFFYSILSGALWASEWLA